MSYGSYCNISLYFSRRAGSLLCYPRYLRLTYVHTFVFFISNSTHTEAGASFYTFDGLCCHSITLCVSVVTHTDISRKLVSLLYTTLYSGGARLQGNKIVPQMSAFGRCFIRSCEIFYLSTVYQWSSTFFGLPPTFNLVGLPPPTSVCKSFFNQEIWFNLHVPRHVIQCYPMASGVESQGGPRAAQLMAPPYRPTPPPAHEK